MIHLSSATVAVLTALFWHLSGLLWPPPSAAFYSTQVVAFPRTPLTVIAGSGEQHVFTVEVARSPAQRSRGLMFRTHLPTDAGMLFLYPAPRQARMWMKDTPVSLDMLFLATDGRVVEIAERTEPLSLRTITSTEPVLGVLELRGGRCAELGIAPGSRVTHPAFGTATEP